MESYKIRITLNSFVLNRIKAMKMRRLGIGCGAKRIVVSKEINNDLLVKLYINYIRQN